MSNTNVFKEIKKIGVVPVIALDDPALAPALADALSEGGLPIAELTFRVDNVAEVIRAMKKAQPEMIIGAGTVLSKDQVKDAYAAGAEFIVSPGFNPAISAICADMDLPHIPGVATPTEVEAAMVHGHTTLKFFPAQLNGGLPYIKALCAPYRNVEFMPTGGVNTSNLRNYLEFDKIAAAGGTWIAKTDMIKAGKFDEIRALAKEASDIVKEVRG